MLPSTSETCIFYRIINNEVAERDETILHEVHRLPLSDEDTLGARVIINQSVDGAVIMDDDCM